MGAQLRELRLRHGLTLRELARRTHYSHTYLSKVESGKKSLTPQLAKLCDVALGPSSNFVELLHRTELAGLRWPQPRQLPAGPMHLVGRERELATARSWLWARRAGRPELPILLVRGPAGCGKTALVLRWAADQEGEVAADGTLFAHLGNTDRRVEPVVVLRRFVQAIGIEAHRVPTELDGVAALFRSLVHGTRTLVVLDGAADAAQVLPLLPGSSTCTVAVTSRAPLATLQTGFDQLTVVLD
jgi:transcriptional regulator with XRE-family HTH domain